MKEHALYKPILVGTVKAGWVCCRINDGSYGKKPFDIVGVNQQGQAIAIEVKVDRLNKVKKTIVSSILNNPHQLQWLKLYAMNRAISLYIVYHEHMKEMTVWEIVAKEDGSIDFVYVCDLLKESSSWNGFDRVQSILEARALKRQVLPDLGDHFNYKPTL